MSELSITVDGSHADATYIGAGNSIDVSVQDTRGDRHKFSLSKAVATQLYEALEIITSQMGKQE